MRTPTSIIARMVACRSSGPGVVSVPAVESTGRFAVTRAVPDTPVPIVATPEALPALRPQPDAPVQVIAKQLRPCAL